MKKKGKKREPVSRQRALAVAMELADAGGLADLTMRRLAEAFPSLTLITAHFGAGAPGQTHEAIDALQDCKTGNLYTDMGTGRAIRTGIIAQMVRAIGADRILFGTDSPLYEPMAFPTLLRAADISEAERELIAHQNAERLILGPRGLG